MLEPVIADVNHLLADNGLEKLTEDIRGSSRRLRQ